MFNLISLSFFGFTIYRSQMKQNTRRSKFRHSPSLDNWQPTMVPIKQRNRANVKRNQYQHRQPIAQEHAQY